MDGTAAPSIDSCGMMPESVIFARQPIAAHDLFRTAGAPSKVSGGVAVRPQADPEKSCSINRLARALLEKSPYQRDIGRAGHQERDGERQLNPLGEGMKGASHEREHPAILAGESQGFFFREFTSR
jgi:hypothetical protein